MSTTKNKNQNSQQRRKQKKGLTTTPSSNAKVKIDKDNNNDDDYSEYNNRNKNYNDINNMKGDDNDEDMILFNDVDDDDDDENLYGEKKQRPDFSTGAPPGSFAMYAMNIQQAEERRARHHDLVKKILSDFNLEDVKEHHRGQVLTRDFSNANRKFRMWLEKEMGTDQVKLSDRKWLELFKQKVMEENEQHLRDRERQLAEAEVERIQKLRLQGILTSEEYEYNGERPRNKTTAVKSKKKAPKSYDEHSNRHQFLYTRPTDTIETQMDMLNKIDNKTDGKIDDNDDNGLEERNASDDDNKKKKEKDGENKNKGDKKSPPRAKEKPTGDTRKDKSVKEVQQSQELVEGQGSSLESKDVMESGEEVSGGSCNGDLGISGVIRPHHNEHLKSLYSQEGLGQLYAQAETLVRIDGKTK